MTVWFAPARATYTTRRASSRIELWEWRVTWCQDGARHEKFGFSRSKDKAVARAQKMCDKINDPERWWS